MCLQLVQQQGNTNQWQQELALIFKVVQISEQFYQLVSVLDSMMPKLLSTYLCVFLAIDKVLALANPGPAALVPEVPKEWELPSKLWHDSVLCCWQTCSHQLTGTDAARVLSLERRSMLTNRIWRLLFQVWIMAWGSSVHAGALQKDAKPASVAAEEIVQKGKLEAEV
eukprot:455621-Rhodomonas_salina.1